MNESSDWEMLARYLAGECSAEEQANAEATIAADPEKQRLVASMRTVWERSDPHSGGESNHRLWGEIAEKAGIAKDGSTLCDGRRGVATRVIEWFQPQLIPVRRYAVAAVLLIVASLAFYGSREMALFPSDRQSPEWVTLEVESGAHDTLVLSDGTRIRLDAGSSMLYPAEFSGDQRAVFLDGEGYFEVTSDADRPFVIYAHQAVVTVLGTRFNVRAWQPGLRRRRGG